jgi:hypothetical protein
VSSKPDSKYVKVPSNYTKQATIDAYVAEHMIDAWNKLALVRHVAQVFCVTLLIDDEPDAEVRMSNDERGLFEAFAQRVEELRDQAGREPLIWGTFNGLDFDYPMAYLRALKYGLYDLAEVIKPTSRWGDPMHVDLLPILSGSYRPEREQGSLDDWCAFFDVEIDNPISGKEVSQAMLRRQHDQVQRHTVSRVVGARGLHKILSRAGGL